MEIGKIEQIKKDFKNISIAVYGDFALDVYWFLDPDGSEISVETGLKGEGVRKQCYYPGGAANIVSNLAHLGAGNILAVGFIGDDVFGRELLRQFSEMGINTDYLLVSEDFNTPVFIKRIIDGREINRIDLGFYNKINVRMQNKLISGIKKSLEKSNTFIFNQQIPESINDDNFIEQCNRIFKENKEKIIIVDSRHFGGMFKNIYLKTNEKEALALINKITPGDGISCSDYMDIDDLKEAAEKLYERNKKPLFITRGDRGIVAYDGTNYSVIPGTEIHDEIDTVGAGDTIVSALSLCLSSGASVRDAAEFANIAASITIRKLFTTGYATIEEILDFAKDFDYVYNPELADDIRKARYLSDSEIEICDPNIKLPIKNIKHVIFDNDGTISTLRQGWEAVMETVMIKSILGSRYKEADIDLFNRVREKVIEYINVSTGIQTILQMEALANMVKRFGIVQEREILDRFGYKKAYLNELMKIIVKRIEKIQDGELDSRDFLVSGSMELLEKLKGLDLQLYLASGTDFEDVRNECGILNYRKYFEGKIYGALDDINKFSKKKLIKDIISGNNLKGEELIVFGDGPVEIKEGRKAGAWTIGVASDENKRFGLNLQKRRRLIMAGAHFIIPDFSQYKKIINYIFTGGNKN